MNFATAASWLASQRQACGAVPVIYRRGTSQAIALDATPVVATVELTESEGVKITGQRTDWIVDAADLVFGGQYVEPNEGDQIEVVESDQKRRTYEAMPYGTKNHFDFASSHRTSFIIHTQLVSEA